MPNRISYFVSRITILAITFYLLFFTLFPNDVFAAKKRVRVSGGSGVSGYSSARLRSDRRAILVNFYNLRSTKQISYILTYNANGIPQGVQGSVLPSAGSTQRELLFGTCSKNVCTYHYGITEMRLVVTTTLRSGRTSTKSYRIKP